MVKITIEKLATMVKEGFDKTSTKEQAEDLEHKFSKLENRMEKVEKHLVSMNEKLKAINKFETRVDYIENVLAIKK